MYEPLQNFLFPWKREAEFLVGFFLRVCLMRGPAVQRRICARVRRPLTALTVLEDAELPTHDIQASPLVVSDVWHYM